MTFVPRPARLSLTMRGARVVDLRLEMEQARLLKRTLDVLRKLPDVDSDSDLVELVIATLGQELLQYGIVPPKP